MNICYQTTQWNQLLIIRFLTFWDKNIKTWWNTCIWKGDFVNLEHCARRILYPRVHTLDKLSLLGHFGKSPTFGVNPFTVTAWAYNKPHHFFHYTWNQNLGSDPRPKSPFWNECININNQLSNQHTSSPIPVEICTCRYVHSPSAPLQTLKPMSHESSQGSISMHFWWQAVTGG